MGAIADHAKRAYQIQYLRVYLAPRNEDGTYEDWINVSRWVIDSKIGAAKKSIDTNDFEIGNYDESNVSITFDNEDAKFTSGRGFFENKIVDRSKIRVVAGYRDVDNPLNADYETDFEGIIDDRGSAIDSDREEAKFLVLSYSSIINVLRADPGAVTNGQSFSTALFNLLNRSEVTGLLTLDAGNITPKVDQTIDDASWFTGKQLKNAINQLLLASNSVIKITNNTIYITGRTESDTVRFQFFGKGANKPANILNIKNLHNGVKRLITRIQINNTTVDAADEILDRYGAHLKTLDLGFMSDETKIDAIADDIIDEFSYPKAELELETDYIGSEIDLLDMVTIDNMGVIQDPPAPVYGRAKYGTAQYTRRKGGAIINPIEGYKVLSIQHDYRKYTTKLKLRSVGSRPFDSNAGYRNPIYGQAVYGLSRYANVS